MTYLIFALKPEAQAFVDRFKLGKTKSNNFLSIIVSGVGKENMYQCTQKILKRMQDGDKIANIGICAGNNSYTIGELILDAKELHCEDTPQYDAKSYKLVDMESSGFLKATQDLPNSYIFKIVSDHFEPDTITKEKTKKLIYDKIDEIMLRMGI